jgi:hypothetical protein
MSPVLAVAGWGIPQQVNGIWVMFLEPNKERLVVCKLASLTHMALETLKEGALAKAIPLAK